MEPVILPEIDSEPPPVTISVSGAINSLPLVLTVTAGTSESDEPRLGEATGDSPLYF